MHTERMDIRMHHWAQCLENHPVALQGFKPREAPGDYSDTKVPFAFLGAGMAGVQVAFIDNFEIRRRECLLETLPNPLDPLERHGAARRSLARFGLSTAG